MDLGIQNKIALVAASSKGLGKAVAFEFSREGAKVAICAREEQPLFATRDEISTETGRDVRAFVADVRDRDAVRSVVGQISDEWDGIDILVCNAGGPPTGFAEDFALEDYRDAVELNLISTVNLCHEVFPSMKEKKWGRIVNITSVSAKQPLDNLILSNTARAGVLGFAKSLSNRLAPYGITVNSVCPGYTRTERVDELAKAFEEEGKGTVEEFFRNAEKSIPLGRMGRPEELAKAVVFLSSEAAAYITGVALQVDGGFIKAVF